MQRLFAALLLVTLLYVPNAVAQTYSGPRCLGPFCFGRDTSNDAWFKMLGAPSAQEAPYAYLYEKAFVEVMPDHKLTITDSPRYAADIKQLASPDETLWARTSTNIYAWKTPERVGLGSSEASVLHAYGRPPGELRLTTRTVGHIVEEGRLIYKGQFRGLIPDKNIQYNGHAPALLAEAVFGLTNGVVTTIELTETGYAGPECLGYFCMQSDVHEGLPSNTLRLLEPSTQASARSAGEAGYCYHSQDGSAFLRIELSHQVPPQPNTAFLALFPNCLYDSPSGVKQVPQKLVRPTSSNLSKWGTDEGIRLGSSATDVLRAYGKPTSEAHPDLTCVGSPTNGGVVRSRVDRSLFYGDTEGDLSRAEFGIKDRKVVSICLSDSE